MVSQLLARVTMPEMAWSSLTRRRAAEEVGLSCSWPSGSETLASSAHHAAHPLDRGGACCWPCSSLPLAKDADQAERRAAGFSISQALGGRREAPDRSSPCRSAPHSSSKLWAAGLPGSAALHAWSWVGIPTRPRCSLASAGLPHNAGPGPHRWRAAAVRQHSSASRIGRRSHQDRPRAPSHPSGHRCVRTSPPGRFHVRAMRLGGAQQALPAASASRASRLIDGDSTGVQQAVDTAGTSWADLPAFVPCRDEGTVGAWARRWSLAWPVRPGKRDGGSDPRVALAGPASMRLDEREGLHEGVSPLSSASAHGVGGARRRRLRANAPSRSEIPANHVAGVKLRR